MAGRGSVRRTRIRDHTLYRANGDVATEEEFFGSIAPGTRFAVWYRDDEVWHERMALAVIRPHLWVVLTPDSDMYTEDISCRQGTDGPCRGHLLEDTARPVRASAGAFYSFEEVPDAGELNRLVDEAQTVAEADPAWAGEAEGNGRTLAADEAWILIDPEGEHFGSTAEGEVRTVGENYGLTVQGQVVKAMRLGDAAGLRRRVLDRLTAGGPRRAEGPHEGVGEKLDLVLAGRSPGAEAPGPSEDARIMWVEVDEHGERHRNWKSVCQETSTHHFPDWEKRHEGPHASLDLMKGFERTGGDSRLWYNLWCRESGVSAREKSGIEMKVLTETLWMAGCYDQVNIPALASLEMISRRICQLVEASAGGEPGKPNWDGVRYLAPSLSHTSVVPTALRSYAHRRLKEEMDMENSRLRRTGA